MKKKIKKYLTVILGVFLLSLSFNLFLSPYNFAASGVSGLAIIVNRLVGINEGIFILMANIFLLLISYSILGWKKTKNSIIGSILFPIFISLTANITQYITFPDLDLIIIALLGGVIGGIGNGLIYQCDYTTGGTDILNQIMSKYCKIPISKCILYIDGMIVVLNLLTFGFTTMLYSLLVLYLLSEISNRTMLKINRNQIFFIQSKKTNRIKEYLTKECNYDVTVLNTTGVFTKSKRKTLFCAIKKRDYYAIKEGILLIDPRAFITIIRAYEQKNGNQTLQAHLKEINTRET